MKILEDILSFLFISPKEEHSPTILIDEELDEGFNPYEEDSWGDEWYCIRCGSRLKHVDRNDETWGDWCWHPMKRDGTLWFLCSNKDCCHSSGPLILHNPLGGYKSPAGESYSISYVK